MAIHTFFLAIFLALHGLFIKYQRVRKGWIVSYILLHCLESAFLCYLSNFLAIDMKIVKRLLRKLLDSECNLLGRCGLSRCCPSQASVLLGSSKEFFNRSLVRWWCQRVSNRASDSLYPFCLHRDLDVLQAKSAPIS